MVVVTPTAADGVVTVEARFNDDEIQPQFVLPIVQERVLDVRAFVMCTVKGHRRVEAMKGKDIRDRIQLANLIFGQVGIRFNLDCGLSAELYCQVRFGLSFKTTTSAAV